MQQKIGVLADVHGNLTALEAVIADAKNQGVTEFWSLGDIATYGPNTVASYRLLHQENTTVFLQGNWESSYQEYERATAVNLDDAAEVAFLNWMARDYAQFTVAEIAQIQQLPIATTIERFGRRFYLSHHTPTQNYCDALLADAPQENFNQMLTGRDADMAIYAHIHAQIMRTDAVTQVDNHFQMHRILNTGTVGQSYQLTPQGMVGQYLVLTLDDVVGVVSTDFRRVNFDTQLEISLAQSVDWPFAAEYVCMLQTGHFTRDRDSLRGNDNFLMYQTQAKHFLTQLKEQHYRKS